MKKIRRFKFLAKGLKSARNGYQWTIGKWHKTECVELCHGFNCSEKILDALSYVKGPILAEVVARGKHFVGDDKSTWPEMKILSAWKWTKKDSVALAVFSAELVLDIYERKYPNEKRPQQAIEAAREWLKNPSDKNRAAAGDAGDAGDAAGDAGAAAWAAWAAGDAAGAAWAAGAAAWAAGDAAGAAWAAGAAAKAAGDAARDAAGDAAGDAVLEKINKWLIDHLSDMEEWTP